VGTHVIRDRNQLFMTVTIVASLFVGALFPFSAFGDKFLHGSQIVSVQARSEELQAALGAVLGCKGENGASGIEGSAHRETIRKQLSPMWRTLPKIGDERVEWKTLRYLAHRHFMLRYNVLVRGLEPSIRVNSSHAGEAEVLSLQAPGLARQLTGAAGQHGFSFEDAAVMVAALEQLLFDSDSVLLEKMYRRKGLATDRDPHAVQLGKQQLQDLLKDYMVYWMLGEDQEADAHEIVGQPKLLKEIFPHWVQITAMVDGSVTALEFSRHRAPGAGSARMTFERRFTFEDALEVAGSIGRSFGTFWESQCQDTKQSLMAFDYQGTGRVRLADFYGANKEGEWRFGESESYLRELGALDETSSWRGKQVIVSNYMQAASNCVVTRPHYLVCCMIECEDLLAQVEDAVGEPVATVDAVLNVVNSMTNGDDEPARLDGALRSQLQRIADTNGDRVPLHGRLFAQWLHYAFPRECAFPHKTGEKSAMTPNQFGAASIITEAEVTQRVAEDTVKRDLEGNVSSELGNYMSQWSEEEELLAGYSQTRRSWKERPVVAFGGAAIVVGLLLWSRTNSKAGITILPEPKAHFV